MSRKRRNKNKSLKKFIYEIIILIITILLIYIIQNINDNLNSELNVSNNNTTNISIEEIPEYTDKIYVTINNNKPNFDEADYYSDVFENYSELDSLGRCGVAYAKICKETMPPEGDKRGDISSVRPSGWKQSKFEGEYLYNRCHLIAYSLSDEDANKLNLITGTRYFNVQGMLPFEKQVYEYIGKNQNNHVLYRVTPIFKDNNILASGVQMEAYSIEDNGEGVCFNVFVYNIQPGAKINYETGELIE